IYQPEADTISFMGNVEIETKDHLKVKTEALTFDHNNEVAQTDSPITFERENISGKSVGAVVEQKAHRLQVKKDVEITVKPGAPGGDSSKLSPRSKPVTIKSGQALFEQDAMRLSFT